MENTVFDLQERISQLIVRAETAERELLAERVARMSDAVYASGLLKEIERLEGLLSLARADD